MRKLGLAAAIAASLGLDSLGTVDGMSKANYVKTVKGCKGHHIKGGKNTYSISIQFDNVDKLPDGRSVYFKQNGEMVRRYVSEEQMNFWHNKGMM